MQPLNLPAIRSWFEDMAGKPWKGSPGIVRTGLELVTALETYEKEQMVPLDAVIEAIEDFGDYAWCKCSECRVDVKGHGADYDTTMERLLAEVRKLGNTKPEESVPTDGGAE